MPSKVRDTVGCAGCPLYEDGNKNFVPDLIREQTEVFVMGQNPGAEEEAQGVPFVGQTGREMDKNFLPQAGMTRAQISIGNAIRCRYQGTNKLPEIQSKIGRAAVEHCTTAHFRVPSGTKLLVAQGGFALLALTGHGWMKHDKITEWRGWLLPLKESLGGSATYAEEIYTPGPSDLPVLCTVHVAAVGYDPRLRLPAKVDWQKVRRYLRGTWPQKPPPIHREIDEDMFDYEAAWDTEFIPESGRLLRFSVATAEGKVYVVESRPLLRLGIAKHLRMLEALPPTFQRGLPLHLGRTGWKNASLDDDPVLRIFFQNAVADLPYLAKVFPTGTTITIEDEMLAHSVLHGGFPHSLDYQASLHATINRHKHLAEKNPVLYSGMDALVQYQVWRALERELQADPPSERIYRERVLPTVPITMEAEEAGVLIDQEEATKGVGYLQHEIEDATRTAQAAVGYKLNLGSSPQLGRQLYDVEGIKAPRGRRP